MYWSYRPGSNTLRLVSETFVIIGAGLAGVQAATTLRTEGFDGRVVLVGAEPHLPYDRPPLSKQLLQGAESQADIHLHPEEFYAEQAIELRLGAEVRKLVEDGLRVVLASGEELAADAVLLCTGGVPRRLNVPGSELDGVHCLRSVDDALAIRRELASGASVVVVGAGWIGSEVAASARALGCEVTIVEIAPKPLGQVLGDEICDAYARLHRDRGVDLRTGVGVERFGGAGRVQEVVLTDGSTIPANVVVVGIGMEPVTALAEDAGIAVDNGVLVDECGATSVPGVFAAGDVANRLDTGTGARVRREHWQSAHKHAASTAKAMLGKREPFTEVPWFWSDQYDVTLQMAGDPGAADRVVTRGKVDDLNFAAFYLEGDRMVAAVGVNRPRDVRGAMKLIEEGLPVDPAELSDADVDLRRLAKRAAV
jgi:3-phenylpropionate/trans-cinnamate dioxygenase ferredoxin reductase component